LQNVAFQPGVIRAIPTRVSADASKLGTVLKAGRKRVRLTKVLLVLGCILSVMQVTAENVAVRYKEGLTHGFLALSTLDGERLAIGDLTEIVRGNVVSIRLTYHFKDGSLQDETTVFSQGRSFRLISDHAIQKGPIFPQQSDVLIEMSSGKVTARVTDEKGKEKVEEQKMKLPPDLANGLVLTLLKNVPPGGPAPELPMLVATPKPRIVKLSISSAAKDAFSLGGSNREAIHYVIKVDIGGVAGLIAPLLGKQPPDNHVWIIGGEAPTFVRSDILSYMGGPLWRTELLAPTWPKNTTAESEEKKK
jgi:hypothetical protein